MTVVLTYDSLMDNKVWDLGGNVSLFEKNNNDTSERLIFRQTLVPPNNVFFFLDTEEQLVVGCDQYHIALDRSDRPYHIWDMTMMSAYVQNATYGMRVRSLGVLVTIKFQLLPIQNLMVTAYYPDGFG